MAAPLQWQLLKIYISAAYFTESIFTYEAVLFAAKSAGLIGATVVKGSMGMGHIGMIESKQDSTDYDTFPVLIEIADTREKIQSFIPMASKLLGDHGLIATSEVTVYK